MQDICNRFIGSKFSVGVCRDANYSKIKSTLNVSYSSIDACPLEVAFASSYITKSLEYEIEILTIGVHTLLDCTVTLLAKRVLKCGGKS